MEDFCNHRNWRDDDARSQEQEKKTMLGVFNIEFKKGLKEATHEDRL